MVKGGTNIKLSLSLKMILWKFYGMSVFKWIDKQNIGGQILWFILCQIKKYLIIDVACPVDNNLILKRNEKLNNYSELGLEIAKMLGQRNINRTNNYRSAKIHTKGLRMQLEKIRYIIQCRNFTEVCFTRNCQHSKKSTNR